MKKVIIILLVLVLSSCTPEEFAEPPNRNDSEEIVVANQTSMNADYENAQEDSGLAIKANTPGYYVRVRDVATKLARTGRYSIRHKLHISDPEDPIAGSMRSESHNGAMKGINISPGQTQYYGFSVYFPSHWETDGTSDDIVFQWKGYDGGPFMFITQRKDELSLRYNYNTHPNPNQGTIVKKRAFLAPLTKGRWHDFRVKVVWDYRDNGAGRVEIDHKLNTESSYDRVFNYTGPNMSNKNGYLKWGIYKPSWDKDKVYAYRGNVDKRVVWHDNIRVGDSWEQVDPAR